MKDVTLTKNQFGLSNSNEFPEDVTASLISKWKPKAKSLFSDFSSYEIPKNKLNQINFSYRTSFNIMF